MESAPRSAGAAAIVAWEASPAAAPDDHLAALDAVAARLGNECAAVAVPIEPRLCAQVERIVELARRHRIALLPFVHFDRPEATHAWRRVEMPTTIAALAAAGVLFDAAGIRYAIVATPIDDTDLEALPALAAALAGPGCEARIGWRRAGSRYVALPAGFDFTVEWPPYGSRDPSATAKGLGAHSFPTLVGDLAKRSSDEDIVVQSALWSATRETDVLDGRLTLTDFSPLRFALALDSAARYVQNRDRESVPFWLLRAAFAPSEAGHLRALDALRGELAAPHRASAAIGQVAGPITAPARRARVAAVVHLYYPDLWPELADTLDHLPEAFDVYVSCPFRLLPAVRRQVLARFPSACVFGVQNLGRDVLPFLLWLHAVGPDAYVYVLKLHGKKSVHLIDADKTLFGGGDAWRRQAFTGLVGDRQHAQRVLAALDAAPHVGLVAPAGQLYDQVTWRGATSDLVLTLLLRLGIEREVRGEFPAGTMFWARMQALARAAGLPEAVVDFEREAGQVDGTLHHAWERAFALVVEHAGYRVTDSASLCGRSAPVQIGDVE